MRTSCIILQMYIVFRCVTPNRAFCTEKPRKINDVYQLPFGSKCSHDVINDICVDKLPVPNIVNYVWCKNQSVGFFQFLSFISAAKFIKPCVFLFHGDALPNGKYWDMFTKYYPRIIHIYRECPEKVGNTSINWIEHSADLMRIEALVGELHNFS